MRNVTLFLITIIFMYSSKAMACEPCPSYWSVQDSLDAADLVIIGKRITPLQQGEDKLENTPEFVDIAVETVLKGKEERTTIRAKAWSSMCPYGIVTPPEKFYVMIMIKSKDGAYYDSLNNGCAVSTITVNDNTLTTRDGTMTLEHFKTMIK
ncbi:MAG: hypothetical protein ACK502_05130 [Alphaproteobacteria bacterium]